LTGKWNDAMWKAERDDPDAKSIRDRGIAAAPILGVCGYDRWSVVCSGN
jgi:hypothetical protein